MKIRVTAQSQLNLTAVSLADVPAITQLCAETTHPDVAKVDATAYARITRFVSWSMSLPHGGLWTVSADGAESELLGCALMRRDPTKGGMRVAVALRHHLWGAGRAFDIARVLIALHERDHWTSSAESLAPLGSTHLERVTMAQLIAAPDGEPSPGPGARVLVQGVPPRLTSKDLELQRPSPQPARRRSDA